MHTSESRVRSKTLAVSSLDDLPVFNIRANRSFEHKSTVHSSCIILAVTR